jgi:hypothetical protein
MIYLRLKNQYCQYEMLNQVMRRSASRRYRIGGATAVARQEFTDTIPSISAMEAP